MLTYKVNGLRVLGRKCEAFHRVSLLNAGERGHQPSGNSEIIAHICGSSEQAHNVVDFSAREIVSALVLNGFDAESL